MNVTAIELEAICCIARDAGKAILEIYDSDYIVEFKDNQSPVTMADLQAEAIICNGLKERFPGIYLISEEGNIGPSDNTFHSKFFLIDPLDGTKEFIKRNHDFTVNIALVVDGQVVAGVVYAPALDELYFAARDLGAWRQKSGELVRLFCRTWSANSTLKIIGSRSHICESEAAWRASLPCQHDFIAVGSSLKFCRVAEGVADVYPRFVPTSQWDTAAGQCVLEQAGGQVLDLAGKNFIYGTERPLINERFVALSTRQIFDAFF